MFVEYEAFPSGGRWPSEREGRMRANLPPTPRSRAIAASSSLIRLRAGPQTPSVSALKAASPAVALRHAPAGAAPRGKASMSKKRIVGARHASPAAIRQAAASCKAAGRACPTPTDCVVGADARIRPPSPHLQQPFPLLIIRQHLRHRGPERRAVVGVGKVAELVHNDVLLRGQRHRAEPPRKRQRAGAQTA